jgi:hypothetical protein
MNKLKSTLLAAFMLVGLAVQAQERIERSFSGVEKIRLTTASGNGTIKKGNGNEVRVVVEYTYDEEDYQPEFEQRGTTLVIEEEFRRSRYMRGYAEWTLEIPDGLDLDFKTGSGNIEIEGLEIEIQASSGSGNIDIIDVDGSARTNTGSGNIELDNVAGDVDANTGSGSIRLRAIVGDASLNTGSGNIRGNSVSGAFSMNTGSGNIEVTDATITGRSSLNTGSGNAELVLAAELNDDVSLSTGSGNAILDFNGQTIEGEFTMKAQDSDDIRAPFNFDESYSGDDDDRRGRRNRGYTKKAKVGSKNVVIKISTGSGRAIVKE